MDQYKMPVMWYGAGILPELRQMDRVTVQAVANEASAISGEHALHLVHEKKFIVPSWSPAKLTGLQVIALMVTTTWVLCGEDENLAGPLVEAWPIREMLVLASGDQPELELAAS